MRWLHPIAAYGHASAEPDLPPSESGSSLIRLVQGSKRQVQASEVLLQGSYTYRLFVVLQMVGNCAMSGASPHNYLLEFANVHAHANANAQADVDTWLDMFQGVRTAYDPPLTMCSPLTACSL